MRRLKYVLLQLALNVGAAALCFYVYRRAIPLGTEFLGADSWPLRILLGILGITAVIVAFRWVFRLANYVLKCCGIYAVCVDCGLCSSTGSTFRTVIGRLGKAAAVSVVTVIVHELKDNFAEIAKGSKASEEIGKYFNAESVPMLYGIAKLGGILFGRMFDYLDECIIGYCFVHEDKDLGECAVEGAACFLQTLKDLSLSMIAMSFLSMVLEVLYYVAFVLVVWKKHLLSANPAIILFVVMLWGAYVLSDVLAEPLVMDNFVRTFIMHCEECELDGGLIQTLKSMLPPIGGKHTDSGGSSEDSGTGSRHKEVADEHTGQD